MDHVTLVDPVEATGWFNILWLIIALPLFGALSLLLLGNERSKPIAHWVGLLTVSGSFLLSVVAFIKLQAADDQQIHLHLWNWFTAGEYSVDFGILYDPLAALFMLLITGVGALIHLYSVGYMEHDDRRPRFFAYLNLFVAAMLTLVMSADYVGVFLGWEGVGLASYLLIGFWQHKHSAAAAARKAFVVNRVGDIGLSLGTALMFVTFGSTTFAAVSAGVAGGAVGQATLTAIGLLLLLAACGKSAQFPLQTWLLDAMEGPTPVSALIHAATMVTAGVYLIVRSNFIFSVSEDARLAVVIIGTITLLMGAIIGCAKDDIKKALAGSTMSQIGYMVLAAGLGPAGYALAIFHLLTHGFFKANMFLGAGSVMHGMNDDVNMRHYGALRKAMPVTFATFALGYLAIIGVPPFAGFWSKDKIIETAFSQGFGFGLCALIGAGVTGFYMTRLMLMTFFTSKRWEDDVHPHESPKVMTIPLIALAVLSAAGGLLIANDWIVDWLAPVVGEAHHHELAVSPLVMSLITMAVVAVGVALAWFLVGQREVPREAPADVSFVTRAARADLYADAFNEEFIVKPGRVGLRGLAGFDRGVIDGAVEGLAAAFAAGSVRLRSMQNGYVRTYALAVLGGAAFVILAMLVVNL